MSSMELLIRADDLGFSEAVNYGIAKTVKEGLIQNVGLMTNMPYSKAGCELIKDCDICLGQHTNISTGYPLCDPKRIPSIVDENGHFKSSKVYRSSKEDIVDLDEVILEIEAQYQMFREITGREPDYFEGHAVASANFNKGLAIVAERHGLDFLPFAGFDPFKFRNTVIHNEMDSMNPDYEPFETLKRIVETPQTDLPVLICHPGFADAYLMNNSTLTMARLYETEMLCSEETKQYLSDHNVVLRRYTDL